MRLQWKIWTIEAKLFSLVLAEALIPTVFVSLVIAEFMGIGTYTTGRLRDRGEMAIPASFLEVWSIASLRCQIGHALVRRRPKAWLFFAVRRSLNRLVLAKRPRTSIRHIRIRPGPYLQRKACVPGLLAAFLAVELERNGWRVRYAFPPGLTLERDGRTVCPRGVVEALRKGQMTRETYLQLVDMGAA